MRIALLIIYYTILIFFRKVKIRDKIKYGKNED